MFTTVYAVNCCVSLCAHQEHSEDGSASGASGAALPDGTSQEAPCAVAARPRRATRKPKRLDSPANAPMTDTDSEGSFSGTMDHEGDDCDAEEEEGYLSDGGTDAHHNALQQPLPDPPRGTHKDRSKSGAKAHPAEMVAPAGIGKRAAQQQVQLEDEAEEVTFVRQARRNSGRLLADAVIGNPHGNTAQPPPGGDGTSLQAPYGPTVGHPQLTGGRQGRRKRTAGIPQAAQPLPSPAPQLQAAEPQQEHPQSQQAFKRQHQIEEAQQALEDDDAWEQLPPARTQGAAGCTGAGGPTHVFQARHEAELAAGNDMLVTLNLNLKPKEPVGAAGSNAWCGESAPNQHEWFWFGQPSSTVEWQLVLAPWKGTGSQAFRPKCHVGAVSITVQPIWYRFVRCTRPPTQSPPSKKARLLTAYNDSVSAEPTGVVRPQLLNPTHTAAQSPNAGEQVQLAADADAAAAAATLVAAGAAVPCASVAWEQQSLLLLSQVMGVQQPGGSPLVDLRYATVGSHGVVPVLDLGIFTALKAEDDGPGQPCGVDPDTSSKDWESAAAAFGVASTAAFAQDNILQAALNTLAPAARLAVPEVADGAARPNVSHAAEAAAGGKIRPVPRRAPMAALTPFNANHPLAFNSDLRQPTPNEQQGRGQAAIGGSVVGVRHAAAGQLGSQLQLGVCKDTPARGPVTNQANPPAAHPPHTAAAQDAPPSSENAVFPLTPFGLQPVDSLGLRSPLPGLDGFASCLRGCGANAGAGDVMQASPVNWILGGLDGGATSTASLDELEAILNGSEAASARNDARNPQHLQQLQNPPPPILFPGYQLSLQAQQLRFQTQQERPAGISLGGSVLFHGIKQEPGTEGPATWVPIDASQAAEPRHSVSGSQRAGAIPMAGPVLRAPQQLAQRDHVAHHLPQLLQQQRYQQLPSSGADRGAGEAAGGNVRAYTDDQKVQQQAAASQAQAEHQYYQVPTHIAGPPAQPMWAWPPAYVSAPPPVQAMPPRNSTDSQPAGPHNWQPAGAGAAAQPQGGIYNTYQSACVTTQPQPQPQAWQAGPQAAAYGAAARYASQGGVQHSRQDW